MSCLIGVALIGVGYTVFLWPANKWSPTIINAEAQRWKQLAAVLPGNNIVGIFRGLWHAPGLFWLEV